MVKSSRLRQSAIVTGLVHVGRSPSIKEGAQSTKIGTKKRKDKNRPQEQSEIWQEAQMSVSGT